MARKMYLIGIDAAPLWLLNDIRKGYDLKGFDIFYSNGSMRNMESVLPPMTGPAWPTIYTGLKPGQHGVPDFFRLRSDYVRDVAYFNPETAKPFWYSLAEHGMKSLLVTPAMAVTLPKMDGVDMITGFPLPPRFSSDSIKRVADKHRFKGELEGVESGMKEGKVTLAQASKSYVGTIERRSEVSIELIERNGYDISFICFTETDRMQHFSLNNPDWREYVGPLYEKISEFLLWVESRARKEGAQVLLVSDHGAQPIREKFLLNAWLIRNGYAALKPKVLEDIRAASTHGAGLKYNVREKMLKSGLRKVYDRMPHRIKKAGREILGAAFSGASGGAYTRIHDFDIDMDNTRAFAAVSNGPVCTIFINDNRFDKGTVAKSGRARLRNEIVSKLRGIRDASGRKVVVEIFDGLEYYKGTKRFIPPDIMAEAREGCMFDVFNFSERSDFMKPELAKSGDHIRNGIFAAEPFRKSLLAGAPRPDLTCINPMVLRYFGIK
ncbi:MAG: alkaline phosphatase family protein [Candidatus Micrarchaeota archaeon]|nr:alkaline phosphatase family protein [Candidatus Micrarchaeota archaeon]